MTQVEPSSIPVKADARLISFEDGISKRKLIRYIKKHRDDYTYVDEALELLK